MSRFILRPALAGLQRLGLLQHLLDFIRRSRLDFDVADLQTQLAAGATLQPGDRGAPSAGPITCASGMANSPINPPPAPTLSIVNATALTRMPSARTNW
jgi:hypothetical protein